jgi:hypothetical protein
VAFGVKNKITILVVGLFFGDPTPENPHDFQRVGGVASIGSAGRREVKWSGTGS